MRDQALSAEEGARRYETAKDALADLEKMAAADARDLASRTDIDPEVLAYLAANGGSATRRAVAANPSAPARTDWQLADDEDAEVRAELARKIARLLPGISFEEATEFGALAIETLEKLAADETPRVRTILSEEIKHLGCAPKQIVDRLARDAELEVATPVLQFSPLLSDTDLLEIIACAKATHVLAAVAKRAKVSGEVSDAIVASLDIPAIATLLANPNAEIREKALETVVQAAEKIEAWHEPLTLRVDMSVRLIRRVASFVGYTLLERLSTHDNLDEATREYLGARVRTRLNRPTHVEMSETEALREVAAAMKDGVLNDEYVQHSAELGNQEVIAVALSALSKVSLDVVWRIIGSQSAKAITALTWRSRLNMRTAFEIQRRIARLPPDRCLPARNGRDFPLSDSDMLSQLSMFGVTTVGATAP